MDLKTLKPGILVFGPPLTERSTAKPRRLRFAESEASMAKEIVLVPVTAKA
jgi:hypothetical protein